MRVLNDIVIGSVTVLDLLAQLTHAAVRLHVDSQGHECLVYNLPKPGLKGVCFSSDTYLHSYL